MKSTGNGESHSSASTDSFLQGAEALSFARKFGALVHFGDSPPLTWPYAHQLVERGADLASVWIAVEPEWPAFAVQGAFVVATSSEQSVRILAPSAECFALAIRLVSRLAGGGVGLQCHYAGRGILLRLPQGMESVKIYVEPVKAPACYGTPWLPERFCREQEDMSQGMRRGLSELMRRAVWAATRWPEPASLGELGISTGGDDNQKH